MTSVEHAGQSRRCAVIYNPTKVSDKFHALVEESLQRERLGQHAVAGDLGRGSGPSHDQTGRRRAS